MENKVRLDLFLVTTNLVESRNKAKSLIKNGKININNKIIIKPNFLVCSSDKIIINSDTLYISRAAIKLKHAIEYWKIDLKNMNILDIGSSTGGFIQVCLENNANIIYGVEVGHDQLHDSLKHNNKIFYYERLNFKDVEQDLFKEKINFITCDVSFISCKKIILKIIKLFKHNFNSVILLKPQFELSNNEIKKYKGYVNESETHKKIISDYKKFCNENNIKILDIIESPIKGSKLGNIEFLTYLEFNYEK